MADKEEKSPLEITLDAAAEAELKAMGDFRRKELEALGFGQSLKKPKKKQRPDFHGLRLVKKPLRVVK